MEQTFKHEALQTIPDDYLPKLLAVQNASRWIA